MVRPSSRLATSASPGSTAHQETQRALMGAQADVVRKVEQGIEEQGRRLLGAAGAPEGDGEVGGELGVFRKLGAGELQPGDGVFGAAEAQLAGGAAGEGVGLFRGRGEAERERALVGVERAGVVAAGDEREGELRGDLGRMGEARVERLERGQHVVGASAVAGADDGVEFGLPGIHAAIAPRAGKCSTSKRARILPRFAGRACVPRMVKITGSYEGELHCSARHEPSGDALVTDAPRDNQGRGEAFSPTDLVATAFATCIATTMALMARKHGHELGPVRYEVTKEMTATPPRAIARLAATFWLPASARAVPEGELERAANGCPVHRSLAPEVKKEIRFVWEA